MKQPAARSAKSAPRKGKGGRPSREAAAQIEAHILEIAREVFFRDGYGQTSIETIAREAHISKRTFYHRFKDKAELFRAVVHHTLGAIRPADTKALFEKGSLEEILQKIAGLILRTLLTGPMIALHRLLLSEAPRFPELAQMVYQEGTRQEALESIAALLKREAKARGVTLEDPLFAAEQFMMLVMGVPQRRAMGLGKPMNDRELKDWAQRAVALFLEGVWEKKKWGDKGAI